MDTANGRQSTALPALLRAALITTLLLSVLLFGGPASRAAPPAPQADGFEVVQLPAKALGAPIIFDGAAAGSPKMDGTLSELAATARGSATGALRQAGAQLLRVDGERVQVQVTTDAARAVGAAKAIRQVGGEVTGGANGSAWLQAWAPVSSLETIAASPDIDYISRPAEFLTTETTEGSAVINAPAWNSAGFNGSGVRVVVIDLGFRGYKSLLGSELPANTTAKNFVDGETDSQADGSTEHGTACAEIIHDIAPNAVLFLAKIGTVVDLEEAVNWAKAQNADIISTSLGLYNFTPGDGTGYLADLVESARKEGILWLTAASNDREAHWGGAFSDTNGDGYHQFSGAQDVNFFGPGDGTAYLIRSGYPIRVYLRWDDWSAKNQDYDLYVVRWNGSEWAVVGQSESRQTGGAGQTPTEAVGITTSGTDAVYGFVVRRHTATRNGNLEIFAPKVARLDQLVTARSLSNLADVPLALTVAALDVSSPYPQESYSSEGPTNGPGGTANGGATKPDISAFANVSSASYANRGFNGTSCATPHVAGAAALVKGARPSWTPAQIQSFLEGRAIDMGANGKDTLFGWGRLSLGAPLQPNQPGSWKVYLPVITKPIPAPVLNPIDNAGSNSYFVTWEPVSGATGYLLQEATSPDFVNPSNVYGGPNTSWQATEKAPGTYYYRVRAVGPTATSAWSRVQSTTVASQTGWTIILADDFEGNFPGPWQTYTLGEHGWGKRECQKWSGNYSAWAVGGAGLPCGSNYPDNNESWMYYGPFSLADATAAEVNYKLWANSESRADQVCVLASVDDISYMGSCGSGNSSGWIERTFDLSNVYELGDLRGRPQVWVAFIFTSNSTMTFVEGAHVDDVVIRKCTGGVCAGSGGASSEGGEAQGSEAQPAKTRVKLTRPR